MGLVKCFRCFSCCKTHTDVEHISNVSNNFHNTDNIDDNNKKINKTRRKSSGNKENSQIIESIIKLIKEKSSKIVILINVLEGIFHTNLFNEAEILIVWCWTTESVYYNLTKDNFPNVKEVVFVSKAIDCSLQLRFNKWFIQKNNLPFFELSETILLTDNDIDIIKDTINNYGNKFSTKQIPDTNMLQIYLVSDEINCAI